MSNVDPTQELDELAMTKPFRRKSFVAMLLGFCPYYYTKDYDDEKIMYGQTKYDNHSKEMTYIQCKRLLLKHGFSDENLLYGLYKGNDWHSISELLRQYQIDFSLVDQGVWRYFKSYLLEGSGLGFHADDVKHRLYLTIGLEQRGDFVDIFISNCVKNGIPYYFKVFSHKGQTDTIVIYVDDDQTLKQTVDVINQIYANEENKNIITSTKVPAPHLYKINDYIGYGFEPTIENHGISYTQFVKECSKTVSSKCKSLRERILNDFANGNIMQIGNLDIPPINECALFSKFSLDEKFAFFNRYFPYIKAIYGTEIYEILDEIEKNEEEKLSSGSPNISGR